MFDPAEQAEAEDEAKAAWGVRLDHYSGQTWAGTSKLEIIGDTPTLTRFYDLVCAKRHDQLDPDQPADAQPSLDAPQGGRARDHRRRCRRHHPDQALPAPRRGRPARVARADRQGREARAAHGRKDPGVARDEPVQPSNLCWTWPGRTPSTSTTHRRGCASSSSCETAPVSTPTATGPRETATSTTSRPTWRWTTAAHRARPGPTTSPHYAGDITGPRPTTAGPTSATATAATPGPALTATTTRLTLAESSRGTESGH